jgi:hypothetical protein
MDGWMDREREREKYKINCFVKLNMAANVTQDKSAVTTDTKKDWEILLLFVLWPPA